MRWPGPDRHARTPVRARQQPVQGFVNITLRGDPPELLIPPMFIQGNTLGPAKVAGVFQTRVAIELVGRPGTDPPVATDAQRAVARYLLHQAGGVVDPVLLPAGPLVTAAADRLAALPDGTRRAWLTAHIAGVRTGTLTLGDLP
jgi:hypothetical protein